MNTHSLPVKLFIVCVFSLFVINHLQAQHSIGHTEITKWQYGKKGAVSITYDDGTINQFRIAMPIMDRLNLPGTFFINTGTIPGSKYKGKFIGRPVSEIINESKTTPTNKENVYERASAARYLGYREGEDYFTRAGIHIDANRYEEAYKILDELYAKIVNGEFKPATPEINNNDDDVLTWEKMKAYTAQGHEFASHMVTHPYVSALDEANIMYELEMSRKEIRNRLGLKYTISAECPYGTVDDRAMKYACKIYPALRNRIPEEYMLELHRPSRRTPVNSDYEYVQWQRGIITKTTLEQMKAWTDTTASQNNIWLVLVIHGVEGIGWEAMTKQDVDAYFSYIESKSNDLWVATFGDATRYMKERMNAKVNFHEKNDKIIVTLKHSLDKKLYDLPLTLKTYVNPDWKEVSIKQGKSITNTEVKREGNTCFVLYQAMPGKGNIELFEKK